MTVEFSAAYYDDVSGDELREEAERFEIDTHGLTRKQIINAVYNAELRLRNEESAEEKALEAEEARKEAHEELKASKERR